MNSAQDGDDFLLGGQRDGAGDGSAGALGGLDDLLCALVDDLVVIGLETNADHFFCHFGFSFILYGILALSKPYGESFSCTLIRAYHSGS
jgi:hypothetical protein